MSKLFVTFFAVMKILTSKFAHGKRLPKLLVTYFARMRFFATLSLFIKKIANTFVTLCSRMRFLTCKFVQEKRSHICQIHVKFFARMTFFTHQCDLFIKKYCSNYLSHSFARMKFLTSLSLFIKKYCPNFESHSFQG